MADLEVAGRRVLVRVDFNVPLAEGRVADDTRIRAALPTIRELLGRGAAVILCSHLGRPKGRREEKYSLAPVRERLEELLGQPVRWASDCVGPQAEEAARALAPGEVLLLENLRFHPGEEANEGEFARALARLADVYVNDAFGAAHRAHASVVGVAEHLPSAAGLLMEKEVAYLGGLLEDPRRPFLCVLGGAKVSDKMGVIRNRLPRIDVLALGGGMANTFLAALGWDMGDSLVEEGGLDLARALVEELRGSGVRLLLPRDLVVAERPAPEAVTQVVSLAPAERGPVSGTAPADAGERGRGLVPAGWRALDVGPATVSAVLEEAERAGTVFWNGPMGVFEVEPFDRGTVALARGLAQVPATVVVGGGDSAAAVARAGVADRLAHVSTGGGASLEMLEGRVLPGVAVLRAD
jgi:phosphoglycerate kinase